MMEIRWLYVVWESVAKLLGVRKGRMGWLCWELDILVKVSSPNVKYLSKEETERLFLCIKDPRDKAISWDGRNERGEKVSAGIYFIVMRAGDFITTRKMLMLK